MWSALGGELKPSLDLGSSPRFDLSRYGEIGPPVEAPMGIDVIDLLDGGTEIQRSEKLPWPEVEEAEPDDEEAPPVSGRRHRGGRGGGAEGPEVDVRCRDQEAGRGLQRPAPSPQAQVAAGDVP